MVYKSLGYTKINHNVGRLSPQAKTKYLIHYKQDVANIQTEE